MKAERVLALILVLSLCMISCAKPLANAHVQREIRYFSNTYAADANETYYALRWALKEVGFPVEGEDLAGGVIKTTWRPVSSDSHYVATFGRRDYGVTNSYHQLEVQVSKGSGRTTVKVGSRVKTLVANLKSSGVLERRVLEGIGDYLRKDEPALTNLGINE